MFKKFDPKEDVTGTQQLKSSVQKGIRHKLVEHYPPLEGVIEDILPKKENFKQVKCKEHLEMVADAEGVVQFIKHRDFPYIPTLKLLHKYPFILPHQQVDKGAIKFVLNGSNIMAPGLTSPGAKLLENCEKDTIVAIMAEGKQHAMAIGIMKASSADIREKNSGIAIDSIHYLGDGLWRVGVIQ
ncbi:PUA domain-containing protein [Ditylenchus destructor]|nr:PUA domain-containing protein [Ditylenchus destructor]